MTAKCQLSHEEFTTPFSEILAELARDCEGFETAVFFDEVGETIDFYTRLDPFGARLVAAYHVVLFLSAQTRLAWLGAGRATQLEIFAEHRESVTMEVGDGYFVTAVVRTGHSGETLLVQLGEVARRLRAEAGV